MAIFLFEKDHRTECSYHRVEETRMVLWEKRRDGGGGEGREEREKKIGC